jgi:hypothetical protein
MDDYTINDYTILKSWILFCNACQTHRDKVTLEVDNFDNSLSYGHQCQCGAGGWSITKPKNLIEWELKQAQERNYHDGLEGVI